MGYTTIRSPIDGYVGNRTARVGMLANVGVSLLTVVPVKGLWIDANFKEDQLKNMHAGDTVDVKLDASNEKITGIVQSPDDRVEAADLGGRARPDAVAEGG